MENTRRLLGILAFAASSIAVAAEKKEAFLEENDKGEVASSWNLLGKTPPMDPIDSNEEEESMETWKEPPTFSNSKKPDPSFTTQVIVDELEETSCQPTCCTPKEERCIDCVCYTPNYHSLQCASGVSVRADFLYWYATETNLPYALKVQADINLIESNIFVNPTQFEFLKTQWDPGFRVGLGWNSEGQGWDIFLKWTYFHATQKNTTSVYGFFSPGGIPFEPLVGQEALLNPWMNANQAFVSDLFKTNPGMFPLFPKIRAKWKFNLNVIDLEVGRSGFLSSSFTLRPFAALRGAWTTTHFRTTSFYSENTLGANVSFKDLFRNRVWGVGLVGGIQPSWIFCRDFSIFGSIDGSLIWGNSSQSKKEIYDASGTFIDGEGGSFNFFDEILDRFTGQFSIMQPIIDLGIGLSWAREWCLRRYRSSLSIGWEHHVWFDLNHRIQTSGPQGFGFTSCASAQQVTGNVGFGGLTVRGGFNF